MGPSFLLPRPGLPRVRDHRERGEPRERPQTGGVALSTRGSSSAAHCSAPLPCHLWLQDAFEIRRYSPTVWVSTRVEDVDYDQASNVGFHRLFDYISGNNADGVKIPMTV